MAEGGGEGGPRFRVREGRGTRGAEETREPEGEGERGGAQVCNRVQRSQAAGSIHVKSAGRCLQETALRNVSSLQGHIQFSQSWFAAAHCISQGPSDELVPEEQLTS